MVSPRVRYDFFFQDTFERGPLRVRIICNFDLYFWITFT